MLEFRVVVSDEYDVIRPYYVVTFVAVDVVSRFIVSPFGDGFVVDVFQEVVEFVGRACSSLPSSFGEGEFRCVGVFVQVDSGCFVSVVGGDRDVGAVGDAVVFKCVVQWPVFLAVESCLYV